MGRQSADTVRMLSATQQTQDEVERTKQQLSFEIDRIKQESDMKVGPRAFCLTTEPRCRPKQRFVLTLL